ncbi:MAG: hypothetical protein ACFFC7_31550 [Candidatus Hermodarchaeota archaeon]
MNDKVNGLIITTFTELGPTPVVNLSPLDEGVTLKLSTVGMTIVSMGEEPPLHRLYGPIPVPGASGYEAFGISFTVTATETTDERVQKHGRLSNVWIIYNSNMREELLAFHNEIESLLNAELKNIKSDIELSDEEFIRNVFDKVQQITSKEIVTPPQRVEEERPLGDQVVYFYTVKAEGELAPIAFDSQIDLRSYQVLVIVNTVIEKIFILKNREDTPNRLMFLASRAASQLNTERWRNRFRVRDVSDPLECEILIDKASVLFDVATRLN